TGCNAAEDVSAPDDDGQLDSALCDREDFFRHSQYGGSIDTERAFAHEGFTRQFQEDALVCSGRHGGKSRKTNASLDGKYRPAGPEMPARARRHKGGLK